jgi:hypothetical protein
VVRPKFYYADCCTKTQVSLKDNFVVAIPKNIVEFALHMNQECEKSSKKFYEEADKTPDLDIKIRSSQQGTIYSNMQILFGMMYVTMSSRIKGG